MSAKGRPGTPEGAIGKVSFRKMTENSPGPRAVRAQARYKPLSGGKPKAIYGFGRTEAAARRELQAKVAELNQADLWRGDTTATLGQVIPQWHADLVGSGEIAYQTSTEYLRIATTNIIPALGEVLLKELSAGSISRYLQSLIKDKASGYAIADNTRVVLSSVMTWSVHNDIVPSNPVRDARSPKRPAEARPVPRALTLEQVRVAREACAEADTPPGEKSGPKTNRNLIDGLDLMISTGMRIGEMCSLKWTDIDFLAQPPTATITSTYVDRVEDKSPGAHRQERPKTPTSVRTIVLDDFAVSLLLERQHRPQPRNDFGAVFPSRSGGFFTPNGFRNRWRTVRNSLGDEYAWITPHSLRDTVATAVTRAHGLQTAADLLGHSSTAITRKHYWDRTGDIAPNVTAVTAGLRGER